MSTNELEFSKNREEIISILDKFQNAENSYIPISQLSSKKDILESLIVFLKLFNVLEFDENKVKVRSEIALNFIKSLKLYIKNNLALITDWEMTGSYNSNDDFLFSGVNFLREIEKKRTYKLNSKEPIQELDIIILIIKAKVVGEKDPMYLFQYDSTSEKFKIIGGRKYVQTNEDAIIEIIRRELPFNKYIKNNNYKVTEEISKIENYKISQREGIYRKYNITFFSFISDIKKIKLASTDRWLSLEEIISNKTNDGLEIENPFSHQKFSESFLKKIPLSTDIEQEFTVKLQPQKTESIEKSIEYLSAEESERLEFKSSIRWDFKENKLNRNLEKSILKTIAAFLNTNGGTLLIGVDDSKKILGIEYDLKTLPKKNEDGYMQYLMQLITSNLNLLVSSLIKIRFEIIKDKEIAIIDVARSFEPVFLKEGEVKHFFTRIGNTSKSLNPEETYRYIQSNW